MSPGTFLIVGGCLLSVVASGCGGASGDADDEEFESTSSGGTILTARQASFIKTSTRHSSELARSDKCLLAPGTRVRLRAGHGYVGSYVRGRLASRPAGCPQGAFKAGAREVFLFADHFDGLSIMIQPALSGGTCDPERAVGVVGQYANALLDTIAYAEGTRGAGPMDGYNVTYSYQYLTSCAQHPHRVICEGAYCSSAAGRYQFLSDTWDGLRLPDFEPESQARGAMKLVDSRGVAVRETGPMSASEFSNAMSRLSWIWASLPPGRYGQPKKTYADMRARYCEAAGC